MTIQVVCDIMSNESFGAPYDRYVEVIQSILKSREEKCIEASYQQFLHDLSDIRWEGSSSSGGKK